MSFALMASHTNWSPSRAYDGSVPSDLQDYIVSQYTQDLAWSNLVRKYSIVRNMTYETNLPAFTDPYDDDELSRLRFARGWDAGQFTHLGLRWGKAFSLFTEIMPAHILPDFMSVTHNLRLFMPGTTPDHLYATCKALSAHAKKYGRFFHPSWKWFVNWETMGGYQKTVPITSYAQSVRDWVQGSIIHTTLDDNLQWSESAFLSDLKDGMIEFLNGAPNITRANSSLVTVEEWAGDITNWARPGSSDTFARVRYVDMLGQLTNSKKSKWRTAIGKSTAWVIDEIMESRERFLSPVSKAIQKREAGKVRAVISSGDQLYLKMAYVSHWLETALSGSDTSTLYMSSSQATVMWYNIWLSIRQKRTINVPLDQAHFDWQQNTAMLDAAMSVIIAFININCSPGIPKRQILHVCATIRTIIVKLKGYVQIGHGKEEIRVPVSKGVLSGWRWTAFLDTLFNWGELFTAMKLVKRLGVIGGLPRRIAQGDDDDVGASNWGYAVALVRAYDFMNFDINVGKFFIDDERDEFLRQVVEGDDVSGYPARAILSLLERNPITRDPPAGILRAREQSTNWLLLHSRGADLAAVEKLALSDIANANDLTIAEGKLLLRTPTSYGGLGWYLDGKQWITLDAGTLERKTRVNISDIQPGLSHIYSRWKGLGVDIPWAQVARAVIPLLDMPKSDVEVTKGSFATMNPQSIVLLSYERAGGVSTKLSPSVNRKIPTTFADLVLEDKIAKREWEWIHTEYVAGEWASTSRTIASRGGRGLWLSWLRGRLPFTTPVVPGWKVAYVSEIANRYHELGLTRLIAKGKFTRLDIQRLSHAAELLVRREIAAFPLHLGD